MRHLVFGGSFDPVHRGHVAMADAALTQWQPDCLSWVPSRQAPHKLAAHPASAQDRADMLAEVLAQRSTIEVLCLDEFRRAGPSYTVDTLAAFHKAAPEDELAFLLGGDSLSHLATWRDLPQLFGLCSFLFAPRLGWETPQEQRFRQELTPQLETAFRSEWLTMEPVVCSSSEIRIQLEAGASSADLAPPVAALIQQRGLYRVD